MKSALAVLAVSAAFFGWVAAGGPARESPVPPAAVALSLESFAHPESMRPESPNVGVTEIEQVERRVSEESLETFVEREPLAAETETSKQDPEPPEPSPSLTEAGDDQDNSGPSDSSGPSEDDPPEEDFLEEEDLEEDRSGGGEPSEEIDEVVEDD